MVPHFHRHRGEAWEKMGRKVSTVIVVLIVEEQSGRVWLGAQLVCDNYRVGQPVRVYTGYLTFSARCPSCLANFLRQRHTHVHAHSPRFDVPSGDARVRIRTTRVCIVGPG